MRDLKYFLLVIAVTSLSFALTTIYLIIPQFKEAILKNAKDESLRISEHLYPIVVSDKEDRFLNVSDFKAILEAEQKKFNIQKIKVYTDMGKIIYSTNSMDIGTINPNIPILGKESVYSELVEKDKRTAEGEKSFSYVVETYLPMYKNNKLLGYFEIYYDVSDRFNTINKVVIFSLKIYTALLLSFLIISLVILIRGENRHYKESSILDKKFPNNALKSFIFILTCIFVSEFLVMHIIDVLNIHSDILAAFYDSILLSLFVTPFLYLFIFKPLNEIILSLKEAKKELSAVNKILNEITDGIIESILLLDMNLKVIWANKEAIKEIGLPIDKIIGEYCYKLTHHREEPCIEPFDPCPVKAVLETGTTISYEHIHYDKDNNPIYVEVIVYPIKDDDGKITKFIHISRDISERKKFEQEREKLLQELQEKLENIKILQGLIPICSNCKKIRNDEGFWTHFETYIKEHSDIRFSHGICPECMKKLYPEYYNKIKNK